MALPSRASAQDALRKLRLDVQVRGGAHSLLAHRYTQGILNEPGKITDEALAKIERTRRTIRILQDVEETEAQARPQLTVYLSPALVSAERVGQDMLRARYPHTLGTVTTQALEESEDVAGFFSLLGASLVSRGFFAGGRRPLRATDYDRYAEGASYALVQFKYARYNQSERRTSRQVTLDRSAMVQQHDRNARLAPWCTQSQQFAGHAAGGPGNGDVPFGSALKTALTSLPGFGPLSDPAVAAASPYRFAGPGPHVRGL